MKKIVIGMMAALVAGGMVCAQNMDLTTDLVDAVAAPVVEDTQSTDIAAALAETENTQIFSNAVAAADIDMAAVAPEGITIFAPVDTAIVDATALANVEDYIVPGIVTDETLATTGTLTTLSGKELAVTSVDGTYFINGVALTDSIEKGNVVINTLEGVFTDATLSLAF